jgi:murein tripeptide amidase MpaA
MRSGKFLRTALVLLLCLILLFPAGWGLSSDGGGGSYYFTYEQLGEEVQTLAAQYPDLVDVSVLGNSVEGRNIWSVTVGKGAKKVLITGVLHASEWINAPVLLKIVEYYAQGYYQGGRVQGQPLQYFLDNYSLTFLPMVNPDGVTLVQEGADAFPDREGELRAMNPRGAGLFPLESQYSRG